MSSENGNGNGLVIFEANMNDALRRYYRRAGAEMVDTRMPFERKLNVPFDQWLTAEEDGLDGEVGDYEMRQRVMGARALLRHVKAAGLDMQSIMKQLFSAGRAVHDPFFSALTMTEAAQMFGETKAAHSWRCKVLSGKIELYGMKGSRLPGQKTKGASESYRKAQQGNTNRRKKARRRNNNGTATNEETKP